jgi:hypothetical protein
MDIMNLMNKLRTSDLVNITGSKNDKLHDNITRLSKDTTWLDQKSISIYIYDIKKRVLLYNNSSSTTGSILPSKNLILPIWGLCNYNESHRDAATRIIKQELGMEILNKNMIRIWSDTSSNHISFGYYSNINFDEMELDKTCEILNKSKLYEKKENYESDKYNGIYFCSWNDIHQVDSKFLFVKKNSNLYLCWRLHRPGGSTAIFNGFQHLNKRPDDIIASTNKLNPVNKKSYDIVIASTQFIYWTILNYGIFKNSICRIGRVGLSYDCIRFYKLNIYVAINAIPYLEQFTDEEIRVYKNENNYNPLQDVLYINYLEDEVKSYMNRSHNVCVKPKITVCIV